MRMFKQTTQAILRRSAAFLFDWLLVLVPYIIILTLVTVAFFVDVDDMSASLPDSAVRGQLIGFATLTLPVTLYFALFESWRGASVGKRLLQLRVETPDGDSPSFGDALLRNTIKFVPWELAHWTVWQILVTANGNPQTVHAVSLALAYGLLFIYAGGLIFSMGEQTLYDRVIGLRVRNL